MKHWSLNKKIWSVLLLLCAAYVASNTYAIKELLFLRDSLNEITGNVVRRDQLTSEMQDNQRVISNSTLESVVQDDSSKQPAILERYSKTVEKQDKDMAEYDAIASIEGKQLLEKYKVDFVKFLEITRRTRELGAQNKDDEAGKVYFSGADILGRMRGYMGEMNQLTAAQLKQSSEQANSIATKAVTVAVISSIVSILVAIAIAFSVLRSLTRAIGQIVRGLSDSSAQVTSAATQIASASEQLSQATTEQAASLEETAASVEEMNSMVAKNSENANSAAIVSKKSQDAVVQGKQIVQKMIASMEAINRSSEGMAETVKVIEQIDKKTKVINEIVNKTELLSFNASVEAARAGEHGKGFAVVAEEVGNLARMSGTAAEEIAALLEESINKVNAMVADTKKNVEIGSQITRDCGEVFESVVANVSSVSGMATEIASASQEQSRGCVEITKAMSQLDQMTQQNAATSEECASAAEELSAQAEALKGSVNLLVLTVNGGGSDEQFTLSQSTSLTTKVEPSAAPKKSIGKIIQLKRPKSGSRPPSGIVLKKAVGDVPSYESEGFNDV